MIQEAAKVGKCVIIGRGSQCVLHHDPHVLRVLVYAPLAEKIKRMKLRHPDEHDLQVCCTAWIPSAPTMYRTTMAAIRRIADSTTSA